MFWTKSWNPKNNNNEETLSIPKKRVITEINMTYLFIGKKKS